MTRTPGTPMQQTRADAEDSAHSAASGACVLCGGPTSRVLQIGDYPIRECGACPHRFAELDESAGHVQRVYGDEYFFGGGAGYANYLDDARLLTDRGRWYARELSRYCPLGSMLDIGASAGFTLQGFSNAGWQGLGIEPNATMARYAREQLGLAVEVGSLESWTTDRRFDLLTMLQVLPHFIDPRRAICQAAELLKPGGYLLIETWDAHSWTARLAGRHWHEYSPPSVLHWFNRTGLTRLAARAGLTKVASGRPAKWVSARHAKSLLRGKATTSAASRVLLAAAQFIPDRVSLPYPSEDLFWMLLRRDSAVAPR